jgi:site-specific DNA-cytosine methylase
MKNGAAQMPLPFKISHKLAGLPAVSLFSGAGGLDLGLERAGSREITFCSWVEQSKDCRDTLRLNSAKDSKGVFSDITAIMIGVRADTSSWGQDFGTS